MSAEANQHDADGRFHRLRNTVGNRMAKQDGGAGEDGQRQRMADAPGQPVLDDIGDMGAPGGDAGYGGDMIGLQRMLHAEQETKSKNSEHPLRPVVRRLWHQSEALVRAHLVDESCIEAEGRPRSTGRTPALSRVVETAMK